VARLPSSVDHDADPAPIRVFSDTQLRNCQISVAMWHFMATFLLLFFSTQRPFFLFAAKRIPLSTSIPLSTLFAGFLILGNLSLSWNPIGFYQLSKVLNMPAVVLLSWVLLLRRSISRPVLASVAAVCLGVTMTNSELALSNPAGTAVALAAVLVTAMYQVWIASRIEVLNVSAPLLLLNQSAVSVLLLVVIAPFIDVRPKFGE
jgi:drug/metabolite transporter (DMT)-like permease